METVKMSEENTVQRPSSFSNMLTQLTLEGRDFDYFDVTQLGDKYFELPFCIRIWYESVVRNAHLQQDEDVKKVWQNVAETLLNSARNQQEEPEILFQPGRVILQDFTGLAALIDLAALRDEVARQGGDPKAVDAKCPADVIIDHCVQVDFAQIETAVARESEVESSLCHMLSQLDTRTPPPAVIVHSTFPPHLMPHGIPTSGYPQFYVPTLPPPTDTTYFPKFCSQRPPPAAPAPLLARTKSVEKVPRDNPGLPVQDDICPIHQKVSYWSQQLQQNRMHELKRCEERFQFLKWVDASFSKVTVIPPGTGVMHKVNLEYLTRAVTYKDHNGRSLLFPDSLIGTDSHTTLVNGLGILGWSVGTLEAESVMFGHPVSLKLPSVIGVNLYGDIPMFATATDVVLLVTKELRTYNFKGDVFVEFFGPGVQHLSISDRSAISNMSAEYGALIGFFPMDNLTMEYLSFTGRDGLQLRCIETYMKKVHLFRDSEKPNSCKYHQIVDINFSSVVPSVSGPQSTSERMPIGMVSQQFRSLMQNRFFCNSGQGRTEEFPVFGTSFTINVDGRFFTIGNGTILLASIASCSNASNPSVMLSAGILAKKAVEAGLNIAKFVRRSLCPGSGIVTSYLQESGVMPYLHLLGFEVMGYGCPSCVENFNKPVLAENDSVLIETIRHRGLTCVGVLSGNRNFSGRHNPNIKANYLVSPQLVVAYAIAGRIDIDFEKEPLGISSSTNTPVFLRDVWPSKQEVLTLEHRFVVPAIFRQVPTRLAFGTKEWSQVKLPENNTDGLFDWDARSTFIRMPGYITKMIKTPNTREELKSLRCIAKLGDDISADFISPAGSIVRNSPAADYLKDQGVLARDYGSYGLRRGNWEVMSRGIFAHPKLKNFMASKAGALTTHYPSGVPTTIFEASKKYESEGIKTIVIGGDRFGRGSPRDWATKGLYIIGVRAVLAISFHSNFRTNLLKVGILPIKIDAQNYDHLYGSELFSIEVPNPVNLIPKAEVKIIADGTFLCSGQAQLENEYELKLFENGGLLRQTFQSLK